MSSVGENVHPPQDYAVFAGIELGSSTFEENDNSFPLARCLRARTLCCHIVRVWGQASKARWRTSMVLSWWHIVLVLLVFLLLFGTGKISGLMLDFAKGMRSFKKEMNDEGAEIESAGEPNVIDRRPKAKSGAPVARRTPKAG